jgi:hypothetical protein
MNKRRQQEKVPMLDAEAAGEAGDIGLGVIAANAVEAAWLRAGTPEAAIGRIGGGGCLAHHVFSWAGRFRLAGSIIHIAAPKFSL